MKFVKPILFCFVMTPFITSAQTKIEFSCELQNGKVSMDVDPITDEVKVLQTKLHLSPKEISKYDEVLVYATRRGSGNGFFRADASLFSSDDRPDSKVISGAKTAHLSVFDFRENTTEGTSQFTTHLYPLKGQYFMAKKAQDYSTTPTQDEYYLLIAVNGAKITGYEQEWQNDRYVKKPVYEYTLLGLDSIKVITSDKYEMQAKDKKVGDVNDLTAIIGATNKKEEKEEEHKENKTEYEVGQEVKGNLGKNGMWFKGTIDKIDGERIHIKYRLGDEEWTTAEYVKPFEKKSLKERFNK